MRPLDGAPRFVARRPRLEPPFGRSQSASAAERTRPPRKINLSPFPPVGFLRIIVSWWVQTHSRFPMPWCARPSVCLLNQQQQQQQKEQIHREQHAQLGAREGFFTNVYDFARTPCIETSCTSRSAVLQSHMHIREALQAHVYYDTRIVYLYNCTAVIGRNGAST